MWPNVRGKTEISVKKEEKRRMRFSRISLLSMMKRSLHYRICVIGSGPSGFYSTKYLLDKRESPGARERREATGTEIAEGKGIEIHVDMIDKLPAPFGLVRYGVAPDHPEVKSVIEQFAEVSLQTQKSL